jgi:ribonuclease-3
MAEPADPPEPPPAARGDPSVAALEERLGVRFGDAALALAALTHKSWVNEHRGEGLSDNERLEFLGDAVIDLAVSHRLMERFPDAREGDLSKIRAAVVDETGLARLARQLDLGSLLRLGRGEELTGGRQKSSLLADALEAVIAVVYVGGGLGPVLEIVDRFLGEAFARAAAGTLDRDYKTQFQELAQSRLRTTPRYRVVAEHGPDHSKTFDVELELRGEVVGRGAGRSKKDAEQAAAKIALEAMNGGAGEAGGAQAGEDEREAGSGATASTTPTASPSPTATSSPAPAEPSRARDPAPERDERAGGSTSTPTATPTPTPTEAGPEDETARASRPAAARKRRAASPKKPRVRAAAAPAKKAARRAPRARKK